MLRARMIGERPMPDPSISTTGRPAHHVGAHRHRNAFVLTNALIGLYLAPLHDHLLDAIHRRVGHVDREVDVRGTEAGVQGVDRLLSVPRRTVRRTGRGVPWAVSQAVQARCILPRLVPVLAEPIRAGRNGNIVVDGPGGVNTTHDFLIRGFQLEGFTRWVNPSNADSRNGAARRRGIGMFGGSAGVGGFRISGGRVPRPLNGAVAVLHDGIRA